MRVTANSFPIDLRQQLASLMEKQSTLQMRATTGQRIENASDDPRAMHKVMGLQDEQRKLYQYQKNVLNVRENVDIAYSAIDSMKKTFDRASEIATLADSAKSPETIRVYSHEVNQMLESAVQLANTKHRNVYLFAGTKSLTQPFTVTRDTEDRITAVAYNGNEKTINIDVAENSMVPASFTGQGANGVLKNNKGADIMKHLMDLRDLLTTATSADIEKIKTEVRQGLQNDEDNFIDHFSVIGATQSRLDTSEAIAKKRAFSLEPLISKEADVDLAETLVRLNEIQNAYTAALQTGGTLLSTSLLDYLR
jgi:flagellar hook-associated protein 3 FlgL